MKKISVLIAGESWITYSIHIKGVDQFTLSSYAEGVKWLRAALEENKNFRVTFLPNHLAINDFPTTLEELSSFNVIILSDIGSNTLLLPTKTAYDSKITPNRLLSIQEFVRSGGGGLCMVGGYMSFQGIEGKAQYHGTPIESILPVTIQAFDDRVETPQGAIPRVVGSGHPILRGIPEQWPAILGYNRVYPKSDASILVKCLDDPLVAVWDHGAGRTMAFTTDCAPHWAPPEFLNWPHYREFWQNAILWLSGEYG
jgi:uncharacterized membrane protein